MKRGVAPMSTSEVSEGQARRARPSEGGAPASRKGAVGDALGEFNRRA